MLAQRHTRQHVSHSWPVPEVVPYRLPRLIARLFVGTVASRPGTDLGTHGTSLPCRREVDTAGEVPCADLSSANQFGGVDFSFRLKIGQKPLKSHLIRAAVLPVAEVWNVILADLPSRILACIRIKRLPHANVFKRHETDWKKHLPALADFTLAGIGDLSFYPLAAHAMFRENEQQAIIHRDGFVDLLIDLPSSLNAVRRKPATNPVGLKACVKLFSEPMVFARMADENRRELNRLRNQRRKVVDKRIWEATALEE